MSIKIELQDLESDWKKSIKKVLNELYNKTCLNKKYVDHIMIVYSIQHGYFDVWVENNALPSHLAFPSRHDYDFFDCSDVNCRAKGIIRWASEDWAPDGNTYKLLHNNNILFDDVEFKESYKQVIQTTGEWTAQTLRETKTKTKNLYYCDSESFIDLIYNL